MLVLVSGSSGWLGRHLVPLLQSRGHAVVGLDVAQGEHTTVLGSVADRDLVARLFAAHAFEAVIHSGALHKPDLARRTRQDFVDVNVAGTLVLLEAAAASQMCRKFVFTSTTSLMITAAIRDEAAEGCVWLDEQAGPIEPRNMYGVTKLMCEHICRLFAADGRLIVLALRTARFFPEDDDTLDDIPGECLKANEMLHRRLTVTDAARAHVAALEDTRLTGFHVFVCSAPTPFSRADAATLHSDAAAVIARHFPSAVGLYAQRGWQLPRSITRVYDSSAMQRALNFRFETDFAAVLGAMARGEALPFEHDPTFMNPSATTTDTRN